MYEEISSNKVRTFVLLFGFFIVLSILGYLVSRATGHNVVFLVVAIGSILYSIFSYFYGDRMALAVTGAKQIEKRDNPRLYRIVENLAITEGLPTPKVYIMDDPAPNAFATGRDPRHASVCATSGILEIMNDSELEGVMAHELGHVKNYDMRVNTLAFALVGIISLIADLFIHFSFWNDDERGNNLFAVLAIVAAIIAPIAATLLQLAISRRREYLADATGALATRYPEGLASALEKIEKSGSVMRRQNTSTAHLFFANPLKKTSFIGLFSTHPPIEQRIAKLREMKL